MEQGRGWRSDTVNATAAGLAACHNASNCSLDPRSVGAGDEAESYKYPLLLAVYSATFVLGFLGNSVALWDFLRHRRHRSPSCVCLVNLAAADLLFVLSLPIRVVYYWQRAEWKMPAALCSLSQYAFYVNMYGSVYLLTCYSGMRYLAVARPMRARELITPRRASLACAGIWLFVLSTAAPLLARASSTRTVRCFDLTEGSVTFVYGMNAFAAAVGCALPLLAILLCYAGIWRSLAGGPDDGSASLGSPSSASPASAAASTRLRASGGRRAAKRRRAVRLMLAVVLLFVVCFIPYHVLRTVYLHLRHVRGGAWVAVHKGLLASAILAALNCVFDPLLYYFAGEIFRKRALALWDSAVRLQSTRIRNASNSSAGAGVPGNRCVASPACAPKRGEKAAVRLDCPV